MLKRLGLTLVATGVCMLAMTGTSLANFTVNDLGDGHDAQTGTPDPNDGTCDTVVGGPVVCTLRAALEEANAFTGSDTVDISVPGQINLANGELSITATAVVNGNAGGTTLDAGGLSRVLNVFGPSVTLNDLEVRHGVLSGNSNGAGIHSSAQLLTLNRVVVADNTVGSVIGDGGAGIFTFSGFPLDNALVLNDSTVSGNTITGNAGIGAGIRANGSLTLNRSTVSGNSTTLDGGGRGGGIDMAIGSGTAALTISNSTISGNHSGGAPANNGGGGGVFASNTVTPLSIVGSTIAGNTTLGTGGGVKSFSLGSSENTIYAGNTAADGGDNCAAGFNPGINNIETATSGVTCSFTGSGNQQGVSNGALDLGALASNGGPTQTRALGPGSVAIDAGSAGCGGLTVDQRGQPRGGSAGACDVGAFEFQPVAPPPGGGDTGGGDGGGAIVAPTTQPPPIASAPNPLCAPLRKKLKKAKTKVQKQKLRKKLRKLGC